MTTRVAVSAEPRARARRRASRGTAPASRSTGDDQETRSRLLKVSERLFADRGFKDVTVREICRAARANVAAINYHFGDKLGLYREVLQTATDAMRATNDAARRAGQGQPPEEKLRRYVLIFLQGLLASNYETLHRLIHREMNDPTPVLDAFVEQSVRPRVEYLAGIGHQVLVEEIRNGMGEGPSYIRSNQVDHFDGLSGEAQYVQLVVQKESAHIRVLKEVFHNRFCLGKLLHL